VIAELASHFHVIAPDQLGFGGTESPADGRFGRAAWTAHALALLDHLGIERVSIIGNSMGGAIALSLAAARPEAIDRLVLMGSVGVRTTITDGLDRVWGYTPENRHRMRELVELFAYDDTIATEDLVDLRYQQTLDPARRHAYESMFPAPRQRWLDDLALDKDELARIGQPALLIHGLNDEVIPLHSTLRLMELLPNSDAHVIGHCGHWVQIEQRDKFMQQVRGFLTEDAS
jgi:2-hydroxymuconate-semialdehyde hydrolase